MLDLTFDQSLGGSLRWGKLARQENIAALALALDIGDLSGLSQGELSARRAALSRLWGVWPAGNEESEFSEVCGEYQAALHRLQAAGCSGEAVRIWIADWIPGDLCGLAFACSLLQDSAGMISLVRIPRERERADGVLCALRGAGECEPEALPGLAELAEMLSPLRRKIYADQWAALARENAPLRILVNGQLLGAGEDFYDFALLKHLRREPTAMSQVLGKTMAALPGVGDSWLALRIYALEQAGILEEVRPAMGDRPYSAMLAKSQKIQ